MGAQQPGLPGSQFPSEDALIRRIQDLERGMRELAAANPFKPMGMTPGPNGVTFDGSVNVSGSETVNGSLTVSGTANFTGNTTIGGTASVTGDITKTNSWGTTTFGPVTYSTGGPGINFTRAGYAFAQNVGVGLTGSGAATSLTVNGPHASDPAYLQLSSDQTLSLASGSSGPVVGAQAGGNGALGLYAGRTNGNVELYPYGTGKAQVYGNFAVTGTKAFIMDHPVNPGTMELMHAATESPVNGVEYWGTVTLDTNGQATATLPSYFEALTKTTGRNIQLTPIGRTTTAPSADRIVGGAFTIYGAPGQEVDWLVKAERQRIIDGHDELAFPAEQDKLTIGPQLPSSGSR